MSNIKLSTLLSLVLVTLMSVMVMITTYYVYRSEQISDRYTLRTIQQAQQQLELSQSEYLDTRDRFFSLIQLASSIQNLSTYLAEPNHVNQQALQSQWQAVLVKQKWVSAIYFFDLQGKEGARVEHRETGHQVNKPILSTEDVGPQKLQRLLSLGAGDVYVQDIALTQSNDLPLSDFISPTFSLITPIIFKNKRLGYVAIDVELSPLLARLNLSFNRHIQQSLLTEEGYFLDSQHKEWLFGHIMPSREQYNLAALYPETWKKRSIEQIVIHSENNDIFLLKPVIFSPQHHYYLLIEITEDAISELALPELSALKTEVIIAYFSVIIFTIPMIFLSFYMHRKGLENKLARATLNGSSAMIISDRSHRALIVNSAFVKLTSLSQDMVRGKNPLKLLLSHYGIEFILNVSIDVAKNRIWEGEVELTNADGLPITALMRIQAVKERGKIGYYIISLVDISERKELEVKLRDLSERDSLTGLWNRRKFDQELKTQSQLVERYSETHSACLAIVDIDHFKRINDIRGHDQGDLVIIEMSHMLTRLSRSTDFVARVGGEEYAIILPHTDIDSAKTFLVRLCEAAANSAELSATISIGVTDISSDPSRTYKCADIALYQAKTQGRNQVCVCTNGDDIA
jgi:diguanylate cyclase (GGDEF)-like protein/PAS domain S-box-containing protein